MPAVDERTSIGSRCHLLAYSHVAHDCAVGDGVTMANGATLGGHCAVGERANLGFNVSVHPFCRIGRYAMVGMMSPSGKGRAPVRADQQAALYKDQQGGNAEGRHERGGCAGRRGGVQGSLGRTQGEEAAAGRPQKERRAHGSKRSPSLPPAPRGGSTRRRCRLAPLHIWPQGGQPPDRGQPGRITHLRAARPAAGNRRGRLLGPARPAAHPCVLRPWAREGHDLVEIVRVQAPASGGKPRRPDAGLPTSSPQGSPSPRPSAGPPARPCRACGERGLNGPPGRRPSGIRWRTMRDRDESATR